MKEINFKELDQLNFTNQDEIAIKISQNIEEKILEIIPFRDFGGVPRPFHRDIHLEENLLYIWCRENVMIFYIKKIKQTLLGRSEEDMKIASVMKNKGIAMLEQIYQACK